MSGQIPADTDGTIIQGTTQERTHKMCQNAKAVLEAAGSSLSNVVQVTVRFPAMRISKHSYFLTSFRKVLMASYPDFL